MQKRVKDRMWDSTDRGTMRFGSWRGRAFAASAVALLFTWSAPQQSSVAMGRVGALQSHEEDAVTPGVATIAEPKEVTTWPDEWEQDRATEGVDREETLRLLEEAIRTLGSDRAGFYDTGGDFEVRVVGPTAKDAELLARVQSQTSIPLRLTEVPMSSTWLEHTAIRLDSDLPRSTAAVGVDLDIGRLYFAPDPERDPELTAERLTQQVHSLLAGYLADGRQRGAVAEGVTPEMAIDMTQAQATPVNAWREQPVRSGRWVTVEGTDSPYCTAGFLVKSNSADVFRFTTAGHCFEGGPYVPNVRMSNAALEYLGAMTQYRPDGWDIGNFSIPSSSIVDNASVTVSSAGNYRRVHASGNPVSGGQYCFTGRGIVADGYDEKCGTQNKTRVEQGKQLYCIERRTFEGDSGGPVYALNENGYALARGTMVLAMEAGFPTNHYACYNRIGDVATAGDWSVVLWK